jgi:hypothetical protein
MQVMPDDSPPETMVQAWIRQPESRSFDEILPRLHDFHYVHNGPYRAFCQSLGVDSLVVQWRDIPCVPQSAFKHADLRSFPATETVQTFRTSGTTGEGFGQHHFRTLEVY